VIAFRPISVAARSWSYDNAIYHTGMLYRHNDIFLTDIIGYDRLKFS